MENFKIENTFMSNRGLLDYFDKLDIEESDISDSRALVLDLGAGAQQMFAKDMRSLGFAQVISVDPRLGIEKEKELSLPRGGRQERIDGRNNPEPMSVAAFSDALPFKNNSLSNVFAMYSVPYYLETTMEIEKTITEILRIVEPGGKIKLYPILKTQKVILEDICSKIQNVDFEFKLKERIEETGDEDWLLTIIKKDILKYRNN